MQWEAITWPEKTDVSELTDISELRVMKLFYALFWVAVTLVYNSIK